MATGESGWLGELVQSLAIQVVERGREIATILLLQEVVQHVLDPASTQISLATQAHAQVCYNYIVDYFNNFRLLMFSSWRLGSMVRLDCVQRHMWYRKQN